MQNQNSLFSRKHSRMQLEITPCLFPTPVRKPDTCEHRTSILTAWPKCRQAKYKVLNLVAFPRHR